jgi:hypothetical protein
MNTSDINKDVYSTNEHSVYNILSVFIWTRLKIIDIV